MNSDKTLWIEVHEAFIEQHGRKPNDEEMQEAFREALGFIIDKDNIEWCE